MKKVSLLLCLLCLLCLPMIVSASWTTMQTYDNTAYPGEVIIPAQTTGTWSGSTAVANYNGGAHQWSNTTGSAMFYPISDLKGNYEVYYWVCPHKNNTEKIDFTITHSGNSSQRVVFQQLKTVNGEDETLAPGWTSLGQYYFSNTGDEEVRCVVTEGNTRATAVKLVPRSHDLIIPGEAIYDASAMQGKLNKGKEADNTLYKTYGRTFGYAGDEAQFGEGVEVQIQVPADGQYYIYADTRSYDKDGSDTKRSFALKIKQNGKIIPINKKNSNEPFYFGSFQGRANSFFSNINDGAGFRSPAPVNLKAGPATLIVDATNPYAGVSFIALAEKGGVFEQAAASCEIDTSVDSFFAQNDMKVYQFWGITGSFYTKAVNPYIDAMSPATTQQRGGEKNTGHGVVYPTVFAIDAPDTIGFHYTADGVYKGYVPNTGFSEFSVYNVDFDNTVIRAYAVDRSGNINSTGVRISYDWLNHVDMVSDTVDVSVPQKLLFGAKSTQDSNAFSAKILNITPHKNSLYVRYPKGTDLNSVSKILWFADTMRPISATNRKSSSYKGESTETVIYPENPGQFKTSGISGYNGAATYYTEDGTATYKFQPSAAGTYSIYYYVVATPADEYCGTVKVSIGENNYTVDTSKNKGEMVKVTDLYMGGNACDIVVERINGTYMRPCAMLIKQSVESTEGTAEFTLGFDNYYGDKVVINAKNIVTERYTISSDITATPSESQVFFTVNLADLIAKKSTFANGKLYLKANNWGTVCIPYGNLDLQSYYDRVYNGTDNVMFTIGLVNTTDDPDCVVRFKVAAYLFSGENVLEVPELVQLYQKGIYGDYAGFTGTTIAAPTDKVQLSMDGSSEYYGHVKQNGEYGFYFEMPQILALKDNPGTMSYKDFKTMAYGLAGLSVENETNTAAITRAQAADILADALVSADKRVKTQVSGADSANEWKLLTQFVDRPQEASATRTDFYMLAEANIIRGDGSTTLDPYGTITKAEVYNWLSQFAKLNTFVSPLKDRNWTLVYNEEFNGTSLNTGEWNTAPGNAPTHISSYRGPEDQKVENGYLKLLIRKEPWTDPNNIEGWQSGNWRTGSVYTKNNGFSGKYGYFEASYRYPQGTSNLCNCSFWLTNHKNEATGEYLELDINEGRMPSKVMANIHWAGYYDATGTLQVTGRQQDPVAYYMPYRLSDDFHRYGLEWNEEQLIWYFDGVPFRTYNLEGKGQFDVNVYFSVALMQMYNGNSVIPPSETNAYDVEFADLDGKSMDVDYVRVYQYAY